MNYENDFYRLGGRRLPAFLSGDRRRAPAFVPMLRAPVERSRGDRGELLGPLVLGAVVLSAVSYFAGVLRLLGPWS